jgi:hypothetical protein
MKLAPIKRALFFWLGVRADVCSSRLGRFFRYPCCKKSPALLDALGMVLIGGMGVYLNPKVFALWLIFSLAVTLFNSLYI